MAQELGVYPEAGPGYAHSDGLAKHRSAPGGIQNGLPAAAHARIAGVLILLVSAVLCLTSCQLGWFGRSREPASVAEIRNIGPERAKLGIPVHLRGMVTYSDSDGQFIVVQDSGGGIQVEIAGKLKDAYGLGDIIEVRGITGEADLVPIVLNPAITVLGKRAHPQARRLMIAELETGRHDYEYVEVRGIVRAYSFGPNRRPLLDLVDSAHRLTAVVAINSGADATELAGATVRVKGVPITTFGATKKPVRTRFHINSLAEMTIESPAPPDPYSIPPRSISSLQQAVPAKTLARLKVTGTVKVYQPGVDFLVEDPTGIIRVKTEQSAPLSPGEPVEVLGFLGAGGEIPVLEDAVYREASPAGEEESRRLLTRAADVLTMTPEQAESELPVHIRGVVAFFDPAWLLLFVQDQTGSIYVDVQGRKAGIELHAGQLVDVHGVSGPGGLGREVDKATVRVIGAGELSASAETSLEDLFSGFHDSQWVSGEGVIQAQSTDSTHLFLEVQIGPHELQLHVPIDAQHSAPGDLVDARVRFSGIGCTLSNTMTVHRGTPADRWQLYRDRAPARRSHHPRRWASAGCP